MIIGPSDIIQVRPRFNSVDPVVALAPSLWWDASNPEALREDRAGTLRAVDGGNVGRWVANDPRCLSQWFEADNDTLRGIYRASSAINGRPGIQMNSDAMLATLASTSMRDLTIFLVYHVPQPLTTNDGRIFWMADGASTRYVDFEAFQAGDGPRHQLNWTNGAGNDIGWEANIPAGPYLTVIQHTSATQSLTFNGVERDSGTMAYQAAGNVARVRIGSTDGGGGVVTLEDVTYGEIIAIEGIVPDASVNAVAAHLRSKWGFTF